MATISQLSVGDRVALKLQDGRTIETTVQASGVGQLDAPNQPYVIDAGGNIYWEGRVAVLSVVSAQLPASPPKPERVNDDRTWRERIVLRPDGTQKSLKEILLERDDGKTFKDEINVIATGGKTGFAEFISVLKAIALWFPHQFPRVEGFDFENDHRVKNLVGYRPSGINEVEKQRLLRTGSVVKMVDYGNGRPPRKFGKFYATYYGMGLVVLTLVVAVSTVINIFR